MSYKFSGLLADFGSFYEAFKQACIEQVVIKEISNPGKFFFPYACTAHFNTDTTVISTQKGFPKDSSLDQLEEFFASYGKVRSWDLY